LSDGDAVKDVATVAHHGYGAIIGALIAAAAPRIGLAGGAVAGALLLSVCFAPSFLCLLRRAQIRTTGGHPVGFKRKASGDRERSLFIKQPFYRRDTRKGHGNAE
jgi:hypothetical protein